jgi:hypothetical protein
VEEPVGKALGDVTRAAGGETVGGATEPFDETVGGVVEPVKQTATPILGALPGTVSSVLSGSGGGAFLLGVLALLLILLRGGKLFWPPTGFLEPKSALHLVSVRPG